MLPLPPVRHEDATVLRRALLRRLDRWTLEAFNASPYTR